MAKEGHESVTSSSRARSADGILASKRWKNARLMSAGMGNTFAIIPGAVDHGGPGLVGPVQGRPGQFTPARGARSSWGSTSPRIRSSTIKPQIVSVTNAERRQVAAAGPSLRSTATSIVKANKLARAPVSSAVLTTISVPEGRPAPAIYTVQVKGHGRSTGNFLLGFYLPGDANGDGKVDQTDLQTIMSELGSTPRRPRRITRSTPTPTATAGSP